MTNQNSNQYNPNSVYYGNHQNNKFNSQKGGDIKQVAEDLAITADNPFYQTPFVFTESQIQEAFETLDFTQRNFVTAKEVAFFLDILGEEVSQAEINEMINMLDISRTGRVYKEQFAAMAKGKNLSPIGIAYPPSIRYLKKRNQNKLSNPNTFKTLEKTYKNKNELGFIRELDEPANADIKKYKKQNKNMSLYYQKEDDKNRLMIVKKFMEVGMAFDLSTSITRLKNQKIIDVKKCDFALFSQILYDSYFELAKSMFDELSHNREEIDIREFMVNCISWIVGSNQDKCKISFSLMDHQNSGKISYEELVQLLQVSLVIQIL